ncbi:hypothetical protein CLAFUW4_05840 [Fulvia fulva]|uniref:Uncharacterized protein n=1 Tax=Passalora fulva TaxID=5499 RepID=A0A9Q8LH67_PASFU|nr:uncharacterized protein CLAFUR5_05982 [Fulvia fulva]KAK4624316.1 hypothetical protein CLAFUR4_05834 [Fulvia fulva]KAK4625377.1 hypothetical protein CLAFUR0_05846 [Fulvia fulva]UJO17556.1 hypothetical protein CLAFUR5_05982 [Fulvia fulva]WPV14943.1 hypothetical protein CLAFUW4_05840 [Fulvia fulva]WPV29593.1 hypothetical protein CLAFUW7_05838 [Fulvia fulva]
MAYETNGIDNTVSEPPVSQPPPSGPYVHPALRGASQQIRLISISSATKGDDLLCSMKVYDLKAVSGHSYLAIFTRCLFSGKTWHVTKKRDLVYLVVTYGRRHCTDMRDKIYGLLPLADVADREEIPVDYDLPLSSLLKRYEAFCSEFWVTADDGWTTAKRPPSVQRESIHILAQAFSEDEAFTTNFVEVTRHCPSSESQKPKRLSPKMWQTYRIDTETGDALNPMNDFTWTPLAGAMLRTHGSSRH